DEVADDLLDRLVGSAMLVLGMPSEVNVLEHELPQPMHRAADVLALADVTGCRRRLHEVVNKPVDSRSAGRTEPLDLLVREVGLLEQPVAERVVDVVVDVGDPVDDADDLPLERLRLGRPGMGEDARTDLVREVEPARDPIRLLVVAEAASEALAE